MAIDIEWGDPPGVRRTTDLLVEITAALRSRPGQWARVLGPAPPRQIDNVRVALSVGNGKGIERGEFEASRRTINDECFLWARYVGGDQ
jgi:hypothetical protein